MNLKLAILKDELAYLDRSTFIDFITQTNATFSFFFLCNTFLNFTVVGSRNNFLQCKLALFSHSPTPPPLYAHARLAIHLIWRVCNTFTGELVVLKVLRMQGYMYNNQEIFISLLLFNSTQRYNCTHKFNSSLLNWMNPLNVVGSTTAISPFRQYTNHKHLWVTLL